MKKLCFLLAFICSACAQESKLELLGKLPKHLDETSACQYLDGKIWTTEDHGNKAELYEIDLKGKLVRTLKVQEASNNDWEELSSDGTNLYIGDMGNNDNERRNLAIYKINPTDYQRTGMLATTTFYYPEQKDFPPKKTHRFYDCEAFFASGDYFYLFTKNRSSNFDGTTTLYRVPNKNGNFAAEKISDFKTCGNYNHCAVTSADISPDGKKVALLTGDKVFLFEDFKGDDFFSGKSTEIELNDFSQKEGLGFYSNDEILITDEKDKQTGGNLYSLKLSEPKP